MGRKLELLLVVALVALTAYYFYPTQRPAEDDTLVASITKTAMDTALTPIKKTEKHPFSRVETVAMTTDRGQLAIAVYPEAAPNAAARFLELVDAGFYDDTPIFRVIPGFAAQFGINPRMPEWKTKTIADDPPKFKNRQLTMAFAHAGAGTASTQVFINLGDNPHLDKNFAVFAEVLPGGPVAGDDDFALKLLEGLPQPGDPGMGMAQDRLWTDATYATSSKPKPAWIMKASRL